MKIFFFKKPKLTWIRERWNYFKLCILSLTYNSYSSATEVLFEPIITLVDFVARWFGFAFVTLVTILIPYVVVAYYMIAIPYLMEQYSPIRAYITIAYGHYLLIMISFHYFKAVRTDPGKPPKDASHRAVTSVCKKCILPKPPRTHHCSVCRNCVLKMDHHCPWINNCVGHYNHRYFISFCIFMWLGTFYVVTTTWPIFNDCFDVSAKVKYTVDSVQSFFGGTTAPDSIVDEIKDDKQDDEVFKRSLKMRKTGVEFFSHSLIQEENHEENLEESKNMFPLYVINNACYDKSDSFRTNVVFLWFLCAGVTAALGALTAVQFRLVSFGETSIEKLINDKERKKLKKLGMKFQNPYHLGLIENWKLLLDFTDGKTFFWRVILPRIRLPIGDGLVWEQYVSKEYQNSMHANGH